MAKRFDCSTPVEKPDGTTWWHRVGTAWQNEQSGLITVYLNSYPCPNKAGEVKFMLFEPREKDTSPNVAVLRPRQLGTNIDDEIPF
jgi:hypothetical protein